MMQTYDYQLLRNPEGVERRSDLNAPLYCRYCTEGKTTLPVFVRTDNALICPDCQRTLEIISEEQIAARKAFALTGEGRAVKTFTLTSGTDIYTLFLNDNPIAKHLQYADLHEIVGGFFIYEPSGIYAIRSEEQAALLITANEIRTQQYEEMLNFIATKDAAWAHNLRTSSLNFSWSDIYSIVRELQAVDTQIAEAKAKAAATGDDVPLGSSMISGYETGKETGLDVIQYFVRPDGTEYSNAYKTY